MKKGLSELLKLHTLEYFGKSKHKLVPQSMIETEDVLLLDVRSNEEFASLTMPLRIFENIKYLHIPCNEVPGRINDISKDKNIAIFCSSNFRSTLVYAYLMSEGYESVRILDGGYAALTDAIMPGKVYKHVSGDYQG
jgi:rhodanese-related sulfurtransferase